MIGQYNVRSFVVRLAINIIAILIAVSLVPGLDLEPQPWWGLALVAFILGLINTGIRPLLLLLALPFVIFTLGLFSLLINAMMLYLTSYLVAGFGVQFYINNLLAATLGAIVISLISTLLGILSGESRVQVQMLRGRREE